MGSEMCIRDRKCMCTDDYATSLVENGAIPLWEAVPAILAEAGI